jgi:protein ImuA
MLDDLRQRMRALEHPATLEGSVAVLPLGVSEVDAALGGGLTRGALHEIAAVSEAHLPAATGFVAGVAKQLCRASTSFGASKKQDMDGRDKPGHDGGKAIVWLTEDMGAAESGALYGPGVDGCGIPPERLFTVSVAHQRDLLWALEEALRCCSVSVVIGEIRAGALDGVAVRRLSLAAADSGSLALLLRAAPPEDASAAATRWIVGAASSRGEDPHFTARLVRNRRGPLGSWILTWSDNDGFAAHAQPLAAPLGDRPHRSVA